MAEREKNQSSIVDEILNAAKIIAEAKKHGLSDEAANAEAVKKIQDWRKAQEKKDKDPVKSADKTTAKSQRERITGKSGSSEEQRTENKRKAEGVARQKVYSKENLLSAKQNFELLQRAVPSEKRPEWLRGYTTVQTDQVAEFIYEYSILPHDLQKDPDVLHGMLTKFYYSVPFTSLTGEGVYEVMQVIESGNREIAQLAKVKKIDPTPLYGDDFVKTVDSRFNLYRTKRIDISDGSPQKVDLDRTLRMYQEQLDFEENASPEEQRNILNSAIEDLRQGVIKGTYVENEAKEHMAGATKERGVVDRKIAEKKQKEEYDKMELEKRKEEAREQKKKQDDMEKEVRKKEQDRQHRLDSGAAIEWNSSYAKIFGHNDYDEGQIIDIPSRYLTKKDLEELSTGIEGQLKWLARFREENMQSTAPFKLDLREQQKQGEFLDAIGVMWGRNDAFPKWIREYIGMFEDIDSLGKAIMTRGGGKIEDAVAGMKWFSNEKIEILRRAKHADIARPLFPEAIEYVLQMDHAKYQSTLEDLLKDGGKKNKLFDQLTKERNALSCWNNSLAARFDELQSSTLAMDAEVDNPFVSGEKMTKQNLLRELQDRKNQFENIGWNVDKELQWNNLKADLHLVSEGVMLRDDHMNPAFLIGTYNDLSTLQREYFDVTQELAVLNGSASTPDIEARKSVLQTKSKELTEKFNGVWQKHTGGYLAQDVAITDQEGLRGVRNLSRVEMVVRERMIDRMKMEWDPQIHGAETFDAWLQNSEWQIYEAIFAARNISLGQGEAMEIAANWAQSSALDMKYRLGRSVSPKAFMERSFAETYQRVLNHHLFEDDFGMGGGVGQDIRNLHYVNIFRQAGYEFKDIMRNDNSKWVETRDALIKNKAPEWVIIGEYAKEVLGLSWSEVVRPDFFAAGLQSVSSTWRQERMITDPLDKDFVDQLRSALSDDAMSDYQALGFRYQAAQSREEQMRYLELMIQRKPSVFINMMGAELKGVAERSGMQIDSPEWKKFLRVLSLSEMETWKNPHLAYKAFDFGGKDEMVKSVMLKAIKSVFSEKKEEEQKALFTNYQSTIRNIQSYMRERSINKKTRMENWVEHRFRQKVVLSRSDFDIKKIDATNINTFSLQRRLNDFIAQAKAGEIEREIKYGKPELYFYPKPGKELDMIMKLNEYKNAICGYDSPATAEVNALLLLETINDFNENQAAHTVAGWLPGVVTLMKKAGVVGEVQEGFAKVGLGMLRLVPGGKQVIKDHKLDKLTAAEWPKNIREWVSYDVKWGGSEANAWDEFKIAGNYETAESLKMVTTHEAEKLMRRIKAKHKTGLPNRFLATARKYWWVVPVATIAVAASAALEDEKKKQH